MRLLSSRVLGDISEMLPKFQQMYKRQITYTYQSTNKKCLLEWDMATPLIKKVRFSCMSDNLKKCHSKWETWIEVG